ncbi:MAG: hypothetical protein FJ095_19940 [Deltaproteobacteria bacterium]|nr:hypothetical protein [Deltaproteobacteria bacterium]
MFRLCSKGALALAVAWSACTPAGPRGDGATGAGGSPPAVLCREACLEQYPMGEVAYTALTTCLVCGACHDVCGMEAGAACGTADLGCSADASDCASCLASTCALEQTPNTLFKGACALEGAECAASSDCVGLNNCVAACVVSTGATGSGGAGGEGSVTSTTGATASASSAAGP